MIIRTLLPALFLTGCLSSLNTVSAEGFEPPGHPGQQAAQTPLENPLGSPDFGIRVVRSVDDLVSMVEAEGLQIEDIQKITLVVKYQDELSPRYLVQTSKEDWQAYQRTR